MSRSPATARPASNSSLRWSPANRCGSVTFAQGRPSPSPPWPAFAPHRISDESSLSDQFGHRCQQTGHLLLRTHSHTQELVNPRRGEMTHDNAAAAQLCRQLGALMAWVTREDKVGCGRQHFKTKRLQTGGEALAPRNNRLPGLLEPVAILKSRDRSRLGETIERVRVEAVLDAHQTIDQIAMTQRQTDAQPRQ